MCEPTTIAAGLQFAGGIIQGTAARNAAYANAAIAKSNAALALQAAGDARLRGQGTEAVIAAKGAQTAGAQAVGYAAAGVDVNSGTAADTQSQTAAMSKLDQLITESNALRESWNYRNQARQYTNQASVDETSGDVSEIGGLLGGAGAGARASAPIMRLDGAGLGGNAIPSYAAGSYGQNY